MPTLRVELVVLGSWQDWRAFNCSAWNLPYDCVYSCCCLIQCHNTHSFETIDWC